MSIATVRGMGDSASLTRTGSMNWCSMDFGSVWPPLSDRELESVRVVCTSVIEVSRFGGGESLECTEG